MDSVRRFFPILTADQNRYFTLGYHVTSNELSLSARGRSLHVSYQTRWEMSGAAVEARKADGAV